MTVAPHRSRAPREPEITATLIETPLQPIIPTNLGICRQDAKFAKVDLLTRKLFNFGFRV